MNVDSFRPLRRPLAALSCALVALVPLAAQAVTRIAAVREPAPPAAVTAVTNPVMPGAPSASGLGSPFPPSVDSLAVPGTSAVGTTPPGTPAADGTQPMAMTITGAGPYGTRVPLRPGPSGPITDVDIARSFLNADTDHNGELNRAEATRLEIAPLSFEEMDANHDNILTRSEYEDAVR